MYTYELDVCGITLKNAKAHPRELTEEEKAEIEAAKVTKGKPPPKVDPKGKNVKEEEPSKEEVERIAREKAEKEERARKLQEEWDALDERARYYKVLEDPFKQPSIKFHNATA